MPFDISRSAGAYLTIIAAVGLISSAQATPINHTGSWDGANSHLYQLLGFDNPGQLTDHQIQQDELWSISMSGGSVNTLMFEVAGYRNNNTFGIYDPLNPANRVQIFEGNDSPGGWNNGSQRTLSINTNGGVMVYGPDSNNSMYMLTGQFSGNLFGYYLDGPGGTFFSQASLNAGVDHMVSFQGDGEYHGAINGFAGGTWGSNEFILGWEDLNSSNWDYDYNDFVVMVESVSPQTEVPVPATLGIFALGLGLLGLRRRQR